MDVELRIGCSSMKRAFLMDAEVRIGVRAVGRASVRFTRPTSTSEAAPQGEASPTDLIPVSFQCSSRSSARPPRLQVPQRHPRVAKRASDRPSARPPCLQVPQRHPGVAKRASISTLARGPSTEALLGQGRVAKGRKSVPLTGLWSSLRPGLARGPLPQVPQGHPGVAMGAPDPVFVHEISLSHGHRAPDRVFVHEMSLSHGHRAPDQPHHAVEPRISHITPSSPSSTIYGLLMDSLTASFSKGIDS